MEGLINISSSNSSEMSNEFPNSTTDPRVYRSSVERQVLSAIIFFDSSIGLLGNAAVVFAVLTVKKLQTTTNVFVVNLAAADFLTCIVAILQSVVFLKGELVFPVAVCQAMAFGILVCVGCSVNNLMCVAVNRLVGITTATHSVFRKLYTPCKLSMTVVLTWLVPAAVAIIPFVSDYGELGYNPVYHSCSWRSNRAYQPRYSMVVVVVYFPLQFAILFASYLRIWLFVRGTTKSTLRQDRAGEASTGNRVFQQQLLKRQIAVTKNLFLVVCVFLLCISPYFLLVALPSSLVDNILPTTSTILMANSCVNPIIYGTKHPDFRAAFARVLPCRRKVRKTSQTKSTQDTKETSKQQLKSVSSATTEQTHA
ncbi:histamine H3 receptor-like [Acanthaster planci]|uniref:Histamine H3 receptor-like n=1 Tax=Acanthaster planci TaxID=133434 RepID=A0A8B7Z086_ACAPL|nr:histamine H3 receptor-like [Acanthaster planci]